MVKVGRMKIGTNLVFGGLLVFAAGCSTVAQNDSRGSTGRVNNTSTAEARSDEGRAMLLEMRGETVPSPRLVLRTSAGSPAFTSYSPQPDVFVVDLAQTTKGPAIDLPTNLPPHVASIAVDQASELGRPLTRVTLRFSESYSPVAMVSNDSVVIDLSGAVMTGQVVEVEPFDSPSIHSTAVAALDLVTERPVPHLDPIAPITEQSLIAESVARDAALASERAATARETAAEVPARTVSNEPMRRATVLRGIEVSGRGETLAIRLDADGAPEYSTMNLRDPLRLVIDLKGVRNLTTRSSVTVGDSRVSKVRVSQFKNAPDAVTRVVLDLTERVTPELQKRHDGLLIAVGTQAAATQVAAVRPPAPRPTQVAAVQPAPRRVEPEPPVVQQERQVVRSASPSPSPQVSVQTQPRQSFPEDVFADPAQPRVSPMTTLTRPGQTRAAIAAERVFTGEPIDLTLKDADIRDVLRTFAQLTGLNIAIDPQVAGTVTVEFEGVPWDQALDLILRQNALDYTISGNVMRVGTIDRLAAEAAQLQRLADDRLLAEPLQTIIKHLSYAKAQNVMPLLQRMASRRGQIDADQRTNQLIITEIPEYVTTMLNLIETIDIPTPQVVIEARVVETTKTFSRQIGIAWGFEGAMDPTVGTGTGLVFPNRIFATGGPFNFAAGNPVLTLSLGNVLGTFDLDVMLTAAENEGLVRIVSAPKILTQDNQPAEIQSGIQIPIQTRVNQTTTVTYVDATLRLSVTPQITQQDTVIMEITVQKTEPAIGLLVIGGDNAPLLTRRATTKLMVRDGGTTVIGGIYQASDNRGQDRMPVLSDIPIIGHLFRNNRISSTHDELLIFITPRIVRST
jgi:type IV pilus secretin PilQ/predicted competence protein